MNPPTRHHPSDTCFQPIAHISGPSTPGAVQPTGSSSKTHVRNADDRGQRSPLPQVVQSIPSKKSKFLRAVSANQSVKDQPVVVLKQHQSTDLAFLSRCRDQSNVIPIFKRRDHAGTVDAQGDRCVLTKQCMNHSQGICVWTRRTLWNAVNHRCSERSVLSL